MYEAVEFVELKDRPGAQAIERALGMFADELEAIAAARATRAAFAHSEDYVWWIVREEGATLARWIADNLSHKEFALDLTNGDLVEVR